MDVPERISPPLTATRAVPFVAAIVCTGRDGPS